MKPAPAVRRSSRSEPEESRLAKVHALRATFFGILLMTGGQKSSTGLLSMARILLVEDQDSLRRGIARHLRSLGHEAVEASSGEAALEELRSGRFEVLLTDLRLPGLGGLELAARARRDDPALSVLVMADADAIDSAVRAMKRGAADYLAKPFQFEELTVRLQAVLGNRSLVAENRRLRLLIDSQFGPERLAGDSAAMRKLRERLATVARDQQISVLLTGETGTGKQLAALASHHLSGRTARPFLAINCASLPEQLLESQLWGYEKGAVTGARTAHRGLFERADGGTLLLDEISEMSPALQVRLLRVIREQVYRRLGGSVEIRLDVRILSASHKNLQELVRAGSFKVDLYYRLAVVSIYLPPLREREGDVARLAALFLERASQAKGLELRFDGGAIAALSGYPWPGNVRELENLVAMLAATRPPGVIAAADLPEKFRPVEAIPQPSNNLKEAAIRFERDFLIRHLESNHWNISRTASRIGISRSALHEKIRAHGLARKASV